MDDSGPTQKGSNHGYSPLLRADRKQEEVEECKNENAEYRQIYENAKVLEDIPCDIWGAMVFTVVTDLPDLRAGRAVAEGKVRLAFISVAFLVNLFIQLTLLYFICKLIMLPGMLSTQNVYRWFHQHAFTDGALDHERFADMDHLHKTHLCGLALSHELFVKVILFLWVTTNVGELRDIYKKTASAIFVMPKFPDGIDTRFMVIDDAITDHKEYYIICLNRKTKIGLFVIVFFPKLIVAFLLTFSGSLWLIASESIGDLVLNSLALAFVVKVDELIAEVFLPQSFQEDLTNMQMKLPFDPDEEDPAKRSSKRAFEFMVSSMLLLITVFIVEAMITFQPILPHANAHDVKEACVSYFSHLVPWCMPWQKECFPMS